MEYLQIVLMKQITFQSLYHKVQSVYIHIMVRRDTRYLVEIPRYIILSIHEGDGSSEVLNHLFIIVGQLFLLSDPQQLRMSLSGKKSLRESSHVD